MRCTVLQLVLDSYLEASLEARSRAALEEHMKSCRDCRELLGIARGDLELPGQLGNEFAQSVFRRTAGPACMQARDLLCQFCDGQLSGLDFELVAAHVENCGACRGLEAALSGLRRDLPEMAEIQPDGRFAEAVLRRISTAVAQQSRHGPRFRDWWLALVRRPRFSWEAAYIGTLLMVIAFTNPLAPSYGSLRSLSLRQVAPIQRVSSDLPQIWDMWTVTADQTLKAVAGTWLQGASAVQRLASSTATAAVTTSADLFQKLANLWRSLLRDVRPLPQR